MPKPINFVTSKIGEFSEVGIESVKQAVINANRNAVINRIVNAEFVWGRAEEKLPELRI